MAENSGFFASVGGDRKYNMDFLAHWMASVIGNGTYDGELAVAAGDHMQVIVPAGRAWINGYHYRNDGPLTLTVDNADGMLHRKDIVVLRWDVNARSITAQVLKGAPASNPVAPQITRSAEQYDLKLAEISIPAGTTAITQSLITDTRLDNSVCGIVTGVVKQVDTTALYNQIAADLAAFKASNEAGFSTWSAAQQADFQTWFDGIKGILGTDEAGNLLSMIQTHEADQTVHVTTLTCTKSGTVYALTGLTATSGKVPVMFSVPTAYASGDTVTIDGTAYTLKTRDNSALTAGAWAAGAIITGTVDVDAKTLTVHPSAPVGARPATWVPTAAQVGAWPIVDYGDTPTDPNTLLTDGKYRCENWLLSSLPAGAPDDQGAIEVVNYAGDAQSLAWTMQRYNSPFDQYVYVRKHIFNAWQAWERQLTTGNSAAVLIQSVAPSDGSALWAW